VDDIRRVLASVEATVGAFGWSNSADEAATAKLTEVVEKAGEDFLKYVIIMNLFGLRLASCSLYFYHVQTRKVRELELHGHPQDFEKA
jgi:hypothetical protein